MLYSLAHFQSCNMSTRKGNNKKKGQKYQNSSAFKNNLHDSSKTTKQINQLFVGGVCEKCRDIIEWRRKFKKYKPLTAPKKCVKCEQKTVKHAYHTICANCAMESGICEKCGIPSGGITRSKLSASDQAVEDSQLDAELKHLPERQRRTFFRQLERGTLTTSSENTDELSQEENTDEFNQEENDITEDDNNDQACTEIEKIEVGKVLGFPNSLKTKTLAYVQSPNKDVGHSSSS